ncbi:MAG: serine--tRNA ligase [Planctomycetota bacterium]
MIDLKALREDPARFREGCQLKNMPVDLDRLIELDASRREVMAKAESLRAEQKKLAKESGPQLGKLSGQLKKAEGDERAKLEAEIDAIKAKPAALKEQIQQLEQRAAGIDPELQSLLLAVPLPPDPDVPRGTSEADNVEVRTWSPDGFDLAKPFAASKGFEPKTHIELIESLGLVDFERGVKIAGTRSYVLTGLGARLHFAVLRYALDFIAERGFEMTSVPVLVREQAMVGTGFFPGGRDQAYHIEESNRGGGHDMFLTGTGEVSLMGMWADEIIDEADLPLKLCTLSTCFRREAGAAGKDTAGLYRIHQFDKVEQVIICRADEAESRKWHQEMMGIVEALLQSLHLPYRLLQCCTADLGAKNADMIDIECWMPGRGDTDANNRPTGAFGETHSASRLYDYQCRRLNTRYREGGASGKGATTFCHSLNNTVAASPRLLIPILEMHQQADGSIKLPDVLVPYMNGVDTITGA